LVNGKIFDKDTSDAFELPPPSFSPNPPELSLLEFSQLIYYHSHFLAATYATYIIQPFLMHGAHLFLELAIGVDITS